MERVEPLGIGVPFAEPCGPVTTRNDQVWIFKDLQRQARLPTDLLELQATARILCQPADWTITQTQTTIGIPAREDQCLTIRACRHPNYGLVDITIVYQRKHEIPRESRRN